MLDALQRDWVEYAPNLEPPSLTDIAPLPARDMFFGEPRTERTWAGPAGVRQLPAFTAEELARIRALVHEHLVHNAYGVDPAAGDAMSGTPLEKYHLIASAHPHADMLSKRGRIMSAEAVDEMRSMSLFDYMTEALGPDYALSDEEGVGWGQICLRVVRPHVRADVGSLHRDSWFWDVYAWPVPNGWGRLKVWVPVVVDPQRAGLLLAKGSHLVDLPYHTDVLDGKFVFVPEFDPSKTGLERYTGAAGSPVTFGYDNLHCGTINRGTDSRVSIEITFMFRTTG